MVEMQDDENDGVLEMDKILEKLLMPPPSVTPKTFVRTSVESLRDASGSSLDRSNDSSGGTNNSWLSDSSCGCHSVSSRTDRNKKSAFVFHKQSLLPPLLCSATRTEMQIYRTKAMEREEKRKQKSKQRLISRVEAILSGVDMESKDVNDNNTEENSFIGKFSSQFLNDNEDHKLCPAEKSKLTITEDENTDHDNQNVEGFHDTAYRSSLRNLLQKSMTMSKSRAKETSEIKEGSTSSESETDGTENTVVETHDKTTIQGQQEASRNTESKSQCGTDSREFFDEEENAVSNLVESVIEEAKTKILNETDEGDDDGEQELEQKHFDIKNQNDHTQNESLWKTPMVIRDAEHVDEISPLCVAVVHGNDLHNQSTSTKVNFLLDDDAAKVENMGKNSDQSPIAQMDKSLDVTELKGSLCYDTTIAESCSVPMGTNSSESVPLATDSMIGNLTFLRPVTSTTASDITITNVSQRDEESCPKFENEFCKDLTMETGSLITLKRSSSFTLDRPSRSFESAVIQAVSEHFHGIQTKEKSDQEKQKDDIHSDHKLSAVNMKKKMMLAARVRRGSYTLDEPSPYLVKNKNDHMISDDCSETTEGSMMDVKRRLDLPSDSEESSVAMSAKKSSTTAMKKELQGKTTTDKDPAVVDIYRLLNTEHQQQMEILKKQHEKQIETLQQELFRGKSMPLTKKCGNFKTYSMDYTISPSRASTEYQDINLYGRHDEDVCDADVSRITKTEITSTLHQKLCKLSALCKGYLTRQLLRTEKVQDIMKVIRDTSRLILSLRTEPMQSIDGIISVRDTMLEDRLLTQLRSAMYQLHDIFFTISKSEQMYMVAVSRAESHSKKHPKPCQLSMATKKSLERKRMLSNSTEAPSRPNSTASKVHPKEVKSKISHIWKSPEQKSSTVNHNLKVVSQKSLVASQKTVVTSQIAKSSSINAMQRQALQHPKVKPLKPKVTSRGSKTTSSNMKMTSQNVRKRAGKKCMPLTNKINLGNQSLSKA